MSLKVLVGFEESQRVCNAFKLLGHNAYSCDLQPTRGNSSYHLQMDIIDALFLTDWNLIIIHPDCTYLSISGNRHYAEGKPMYYKRVEAIHWTLELWKIVRENCEFGVLENPQSVIFKYCPTVQYIQPHMFGHGETKKTGLALHNLPFLKPSNQVPGRDDRIHKMAPSVNRKRDRSETYNGIANAMAEQWGNYITEKLNGHLRKS